VLFTSLQYGVFFVIVFTGHWILPQLLRRPFLLIASLYFYASAFPQYVLLIIALTAFNYFMGLLIARAAGRLRGILLAFAIVGNLGTLAYFKYSQLFVSTIESALRRLPLLSPLGSDPLMLNILLPLGISFFTFEFIHYVVEVYKGMPAMFAPIDFSLFAAFFPTQIAGPIKRFPDWAKQLKHPLRLRAVNVDGGVWLILRGLLKKIIVADTLAPHVATAFAAPATLGAASAWFAVLAFALQIYCDFSGYTDIGRGCAQLLGYQVPENFNSPYQANSPSAFWHRWHMSLSTWLRDYLFIPLGGSRVSQPRIYLNLMITMSLGGLWHGASWHFMVWGAYQGALLCGHRLWGATVGATRWYRSAMRFPLLDFLSRPATFALICVGWVFFRANTLSGSLQMLRSMVSLSRPWTAGLALTPTSTSVLLLAGAAAVVVGGWIWAVLETSIAGAWRRLGLAQRVKGAWAWGMGAFVLRPALYTSAIAVLALWPPHEVQRFIYFQF
jgi:alginate O-acetyltransferase complex protein AlgI